MSTEPNCERQTEAEDRQRIASIVPPHLTNLEHSSDISIILAALEGRETREVGLEAVKHIEAYIDFCLRIDTKRRERIAELEAERDRWTKIAEEADLEFRKERKEYISLQHKFFHQSGEVERLKTHIVGLPNLIADRDQLKVRVVELEEENKRKSMYRCETCELRRSPNGV